MTLDGAGRYSVLLGATQPEGLPMNVFGVRRGAVAGAPLGAGEPEQARVLLTVSPAL